MCQVSIFSLVQFQGYRGLNFFPIFPTWLPHHVTYDVIIIKIFYMSCRSYHENFVSIRQAVAAKNTDVLRGQRNKQTDTDPNAKPSP